MADERNNNTSEQGGSQDNREMTQGDKSTHQSESERDEDE